MDDPKNETLRRCRLYGIIDLSYASPNEIGVLAKEMIAGGVDILQLRAKAHALPAIEKMAAELHAITRGAGVPLIINDHPEILRTVPAEGVHLGQDDLTSAEARKMIGRNCLIGRSTHSLEQAVAASRDDIDYIGFGPLFATPTKPDYPPIGLEEIAEVHAKLSLPIFCIGGIKRENLPRVLSAGARRVVIVSGLLQAKQVQDYARDCRILLNQAT